MEMEWETRPLSMVHRTRDWHSSINHHDSAAGPSTTATVTMSASSSMSARRRSSIVNVPPLGPPPNQPIPRLPSHLDNNPYGDYEDDAFTSGQPGNDFMPTTINGPNTNISLFQRPGGSASLAAVAAFSQARISSSAAGPSTLPPRTSRNLSDPPPRSLLPASARQAPSSSSQEIMPGKLLLSPPEPASPPRTRPSSRRALTRALELAREAVRLDSTNDDPHGAIVAYGQSVALLNEVMERVMRGEDSTEQSHRRRNGRRRSIVAQEEEVRRLKSIHDTYADRMNILSLIYSIPPVPYSPAAEFMRFSGESTTPSASSPTSNSPSSESSGLPQSSASTEPDQSEYQTATEEVPNPIAGSAVFTLDTRRTSSTSTLPTITGAIAPLVSIPIRPQSRDSRSDASLSAGASMGIRPPNVPPIRPPPSGRPPARPRSSSILPPQPPPPLVSPPVTPTIVEPDQPSPRRTSQFSSDLGRARGNSVGHKRTGSGSRLSSLQEETDTLQAQQQHHYDVESDLRPQSAVTYLAPRSHSRDSPLPPLPSPISDSGSSNVTPRVAAPEQSIQIVNTSELNTSPAFATPRPRGRSTTNIVKSEKTPTAPVQQNLISDSITMGTIHKRRNTPSAPPSMSESSTSDLNGTTVPTRLTGSSLPASTAISLGIGRNRASSQPVRPSLAHAQSSPPEQGFSRPPVPSTIPPRKMSYSLRLPPLPQTASHPDFLAATIGTSATALVPPPPVLTGQLPTTPTSPLPPLPPNDPLRKPYHLMNLLRQTMTSKSGGYITRRLHVPCEVWSQGGAKLNNLLEKVRVVEVLCDALMELQNGSVEFCGPMGAASGMGLGIGTVGRKEGEQWFSKIDEFSSVCDGVVGNVGKKLGVGEGFVVKKSTGMTFWGGKFARQFDKLTNGKNLDSPASYVQGLTRLFELSQLLDDHTKALSSYPMAPTYAALPVELRTAFEFKFRRSSEFFASVVLTFVIRDLSQLLDKYAKKCEKWLAE